MSRYPLNLPHELKQEAERAAGQQGVSLNQFVLWAVAEKVASLRSRLDDPRFPHITYRTGAAGRPTPVIRGTGIRVQAIVVANRTWAMTPAQIAEDYDLAEVYVKDALGFYEAHRPLIDAMMQEERDLAASRG